MVLGCAPWKKSHCYHPIITEDLAWNFDVIALSETWNDEKNKNDFTPPILEGYHSYVGSTGSSQNGGVGYYIKDTLTAIPREDLQFKITDKNSQCETKWAELTDNTGPNTLLGVFYRHPSGQIEKFMTNLESTLNKQWFMWTHLWMKMAKMMADGWW